MGEARGSAQYRSNVTDGSFVTVERFVTVGSFVIVRSFVSVGSYFIKSGQALHVCRIWGYNPVIIDSKQ